MSYQLVRLGALALAVTLPLPLSAQQDSQLLHLNYARFDPARSAPDVADGLRGGATTRLWVVQFGGAPTDAMRAAVRDAGAEIHGYLPENAYIVRVNRDVVPDLQRLTDVRAVCCYHPAYRLEPALLDEHARGDIPTRRYNIVAVDKRTDKPGLMAAIRNVGGRVDHEQQGSILIEATLSADQLLRVAAMDEVLWIDRWSAPELDMNNARIQGGGNYIESVGGFTGQGIRGHIYEGVESGHQDFNTAPTNVRSSGAAESHGHCTAGIVFGNGTSNAAARGMAPDVVGFYTNYSSVQGSRWQVVQDLVNQHQVMFTTASWGSSRTTSYTSTSADADDIIFDHDMPWTQSQSNAGNQQSRPQAWAKNIFSIGGIDHQNNSNPGDDSWRSGGASTGPAADGRIKPDLCAYYENIHCSDRTGSAGYSSGNSYTNFGGTSGATPIVAGHNALAIQMFTDGVFGNTLRVPGGTRFQNRPHFTTLKALQIANAQQYSFNASSNDNRREHQGWGFPGLRSMWDNRGAHFIVDETDVLKQSEGTRYSISVGAGLPELKISMTYADPAGNPSSSRARINDLTLRVVSPSGTVYWGNNGLDRGNYSVAGGAPNIVDTVENVFVQNPEAGTWSVDVVAQLVAQDSHVETSEVDADYALVVVGGVSTGQQTIKLGTFATFGTSCLGSVVNLRNVCVSRNVNQSLAGQTLRSSVGYALRATAPTDLQITSFELRTSSSSGTQTVPTAIYDEVGGQPGSVIATGTMQVGTNTRWWAASFEPPVSIPSGQSFYMFFQNSSSPLAASTTSSGTTVRYFRNDGSGGAWTGPYTTVEWAYRVNCPGGLVAPVLSSNAAPGIGSSFDVSLSQALPDAVGALVVAGSNTQSPFGALPISLGAAGAPGCDILTSTDLLLPVVTGPTGAVSVTLEVPRSQALIDAQTFHQFLVVDTQANQLGIAVTNGGVATIGF